MLAPHRAFVALALSPTLWLCGELAAQARPFDPVRDLPGYGAAATGEHRELYDLRPFAAAPEAELTAEALTSLRQRWNAEQQRVAQRLESIARDPNHARAWALEQGLRRHPLLARVDVVTHLEHLPLVFFVPRSTDDAPHAARLLIWRYLPWLQVARDRFAELGSGPGDRRPAPDTVFAVAVLPFAAYDAFRAATPAHDLLPDDALYDRDLQLTITHDAVESERSARRAVLHAFVHGLQHARTPSPPVRTLWVAEGLAEYFGGALATRPEQLRQPTIDPLLLRSVTKALDDPRSRVLGSTIAELTALAGPGYGAVDDAVRQRAPERVLTPSASRAAREVFRAQSTALLHFLLASERHRAAALRYLQSALDGGNVDGLAATLGVTAENLEAEFAQWVTAESGRDAAVSTGVAKLATEPAPATAPTFDGSGLAFDATAWRLRLAATIELAARGELSQAEAAAAGPGGDGAERLARERARLQALRAWREELLADLQGRRTTLTVHTADANGSGTIDAWSGDAISVAVPGQGTLTGRAHAEDLFQAGLRAGTLKGDKLWLGGLLQALAGAPIAHARGKLRDSAAPARELRDELDDYYDKTLRAAGGAAALITTIAASSTTPSDPAANRTALASLRASLAADGDSELIAARRLELERYARALLWNSFDPERAECLALHGEVRRLPDGSVSVHYDLARPEALLDFDLVDDPLGDPLATVPALRPAVQTTATGVTTRGSVALRHVLPLATPLRARCTAMLDVDCGLRLFVVDDARGNISMSESGYVILNGTAGGDSMGYVGGVYVGASYDYEIAHDGVNVTAARDGKAIEPSGRFAPLANAHGLLAGSGASVLFEKFDIEGRIGTSATAVAAMRERWIRTQLQALFGGSIGPIQRWRVNPELTTWDGKPPPLPDAETLARWSTELTEQMPRGLWPEPGNASGAINLGSVFAKARWCSTRLLAQVRARPGAARLHLDADDGARVWWNGALVLDRVGGAPPTDNAGVAVTLVEGANVLLVQSFHRAGKWPLSLRATDANGRPLAVTVE